MSNERRAYTPAEELALTTQVDGRCPLCTEALFYTKKSRTYKAYELAHIYPLNPTTKELEELRSVARLHSDVNHPDNLIPLCLTCHGKFDKPRTAEEYRHLAARKKQLLRRTEQQEIQATYPLEGDIRRVVLGLHNHTPVNGTNLEYDPKRLQDKFDDSLPVLTRLKIKHAVTDFYQYVRGEFMEIERESPAASQLISSQVRTYYLKQKSLGLSQHDIFVNVVEWIRARTEPQTIESAEIVASYFVQNCEVFE